MLRRQRTQEGLFSFFFSSRRRHTRCSRDWSSDVCSSDLVTQAITDGRYVGWVAELDAESGEIVGGAGLQLRELLPRPNPGRERLVRGPQGRSEERREGKEGRSRWAPDH